MRLRHRLILAAALVASTASSAADPLDAVTAGGDRVRLFPNGRWEYVDPKKAEAQRPVVQAYDQQHDAEKAAEQGGLFGFGRKVKPGDPDYNRGSLGGKH